LEGGLGVEEVAAQSVVDDASPDHDPGEDPESTEEIEPSAEQDHNGDRGVEKCQIGMSDMGPCLWAKARMKANSRGSSLCLELAPRRPLLDPMAAGAEGVILSGASAPSCP